MARRDVSVFGLAFLDAMTCGLGAVILLFMVITASAGVQSDRTATDLQAEVDRLDEEVLEGHEQLVELRNSREETERTIVISRGLSRRVIEALAESQEELATSENTSLATREHVNKLKSDLKTLEEETKRLSANLPSDETPGDKVRTFVGDGDRQYLTGLKVGGRRTLILVDASASMLDETLVNIIRFRNLSEARRRLAPKWIQAVATVDWISTQLPKDSRYQLYTFDEKPAPILPETAGTWLDAGDRETLDRAVAGIRQTAPQRGTNLYRAFDAIDQLRPKPDNLILLVDGLPTQGRKESRRTMISGRQRLKLFEQAADRLDRGIPVNVILFPMEGDPLAAAAYWKLAQGTNGSFLTPSEDWP